MPRSDQFWRDPLDDSLVREATPRPPGRPYQHRCTLAIYRRVAGAIDGAHGGTTGEQIARSLDAPWTQVFVALAFLEERGCVVRERRRVFPASGFAYEDAMCELHALGEVTP